MTGKLVLITGKSTTGKSYSLEHLNEPNKVLYLNCEAGKLLPFKNTFKREIITAPLTELIGDGSFLRQASNHPDKIKTVVLDSLTFLMDMYETKYIKTATNTQQAWGTYADFFINLLNQEIPLLIKAGINVIVTAHVADRYNESELAVETSIPIKGSIGKKGAEAFFENMVSTKKMKLKDLEGYENDLLHITEDDKELGFKHVFQTRLTKDTVNERLRENRNMWKRNETFIDNDIQLVLNRINEFYGE